MEDLAVDLRGRPRFVCLAPVVSVTSDTFDEVFEFFEAFSAFRAVELLTALPALALTVFEVLEAAFFGCVVDFDELEAGLRWEVGSCFFFPEELRLAVEVLIGIGLAVSLNDFRFFATFFADAFRF